MGDETPVTTPSRAVSGQVARVAKPNGSVLIRDFSDLQVRHRVFLQCSVSQPVSARKRMCAVGRLVSVDGSCFRAGACISAKPRMCLWRTRPRCTSRMPPSLTAIRGRRKLSQHRPTATGRLRPIAVNQRLIVLAGEMETACAGCSPIPRSASPRFCSPGNVRGLSG